MGGNGEQTDTQQRTPLHFAAANNHTAIITWLQAQGAAINAQDGSNRTPLHMAAYKGQVEAVASLLTAGADKTLKTIHHKTAHRTVLEKLEHFNRDAFISHLRHSADARAQAFMDTERTRLTALLFQFCDTACPESGSFPPHTDNAS